MGSTTVLYMFYFQEKSYTGAETESGTGGTIEIFVIEIENEIFLLTKKHN